MVSYLQVENLTKSFGDLVLFENISFSVGERQRVSLIAKNGAGKTTLLGIIAGNDSADNGTVTTRRDLRIAYLEQNPHFSPGMTILQACFDGDNPVLSAIAEYEAALLASGTTEAQDTTALERAMAQMDSLGAWDYEQRAKQVLSRLKIDDFNRPVQHLSGGQLKRIALARVLISESDLLILDEPTNHLDMDMTLWLEEYLLNSSAALLMVTHDRYFLDRVCNEIIEIDGGQVYNYHGNYSYYLTKREERITASASQRESDTNLFRKELEWMRRQPQARATKAQARIDAFHNLEERLRTTRSAGNVRLDVKASYIGTKIFEARNLYKSFGEINLIEDFEYTFSRYEKMGIVGNNGCGKSTFIKLLLGIEKPDKGTITVGESVNFGYYSQAGLEFDPNAKVLDVVSDIAEEIILGDGRRMSASQFLQYFLFTPETQHNFVSRLSGGEKRRLYLCTILMRSPNFLVLDEPTNDLDIVTLGVLEEYLQAYKGCLIVVSHDRYFMDKVVDHLLIFCGDGEIKGFTGSYTDYIDWKRDYDEARRVAKAESKPKPQERQREPVSRKLTFNEKREMEALEAQIPQLEELKAQIEAQLSSGTLPVEELMAKSKQIGELISSIDEKSMRWLELSEI